MRNEHAQLLRIFAIIKFLNKKPYSVARLASMLDINQRTIYRDLKAIEEIGVSIDGRDYDRTMRRKGHMKYFIFGPCPCCGQNVDKKMSMHGSS